VSLHTDTVTVMFRFGEAPWEIEQVLDRSDIGLCLETGHMMLGGGDPVALLRDWAERVNHVHLKDASLAVRDQIVADGAQATAIWSREGSRCLAAATSTWTRSLTGCAACPSAAGWWWSRTSCRAARSGSRGRPRTSGSTGPSSRRGGCDMAAPFRLGLIGAGRMGRTHLRGLAG
jgi:hypothetical protein